MGRPKKQAELGWFENLHRSFEALFLLIVYIAANSTACYIDTESGSMMLVPSTLLLKRTGVVNNVFFVSVIGAAAAYLISNNMDAFFIVVVHSLFFGVVTWINPEPLFLLFMHTVISGSMLYDPITTLALITMVISAVTMFREFELPMERVAVFVMSIATTAFFGTIAAAVASIFIGVAIIILKLRPFQPPTLVLVALGSLALILVANRIAGSIVLFMFIVVITALFLINRIYKNLDLQQPDSESSSRRKSSHPNGYLALSNITESLDLHGHTVTGAMKALHEFLREHEDEYRKNRAQHVRHVTIVTGEGNYSDQHDSSNLVKPTVVNFLKINKYKYEISSESPGLIKVDLESHII